MITKADRVRNLLSAARDCQEAGQYDCARQRLQLALRYATGAQKADVQARIDAMPVRRFGRRS